MIRITDFYKSVLPSKGVYCISTIEPTSGKTTNHFVESIDEIEPKIEELKLEKQNIYVTHSSQKNYSRKDNALYSSSFFVDLDVGEDKDYKSKEEANNALDEFVKASGLPKPTKLDSGRGMWGWWPFGIDIPIDEWKLYADKFKKLCIDKGLKIDPSVTSDKARITRAPNCLNYKTSPPSETKVISDAIVIHNFDDFKAMLGEEELSVADILKSIPKGLSEEEKKLNKNFGYSFSNLVLNSYKTSDKGCAQIKHIIDHASSLTEPIWRAGLTIAVNCDDWETAIHKMSEGHPGYTPEATIAKINSMPEGKDTRKVFTTCDGFNELNPNVCTGCPNRKVGTPLNLAKKFIPVIAPVNPEPVRTHQELISSVNIVDRMKMGITSLPQELSPFMYGMNGGIYYQPPAERDENGVPLPPPRPILVCKDDLYVTKRISSATEGDCLVIRLILPHDPPRELMLPMKHVYAIEKFKEAITSIGVYFDPASKEGGLLMSYIIKWGDYLKRKGAAEIMRTQMGWTPNRESFVVGANELTRDGKVINSPTSPLCRGIAKHLTQVGSYDIWKTSANKLNNEGLELHAFTLLAGFGSVLMDYTSTSGVTLALTGESGAAKTGALYSALSIWGNPKDLSVLDATENGLTGRFLGLRNLPFGLDEVGNTEGKLMSKIIHKISQGKSKIRMQASVNAEREHEMSASLISIFTSNHSLYDKLTLLKKDPNGEVARLIEMTIRKPDMFKDDAALGREIFDVFRFNYGWAGPDFIFALFNEGEEAILKMIDKWCLRFKADFGDDTAYRFYENSVAVCLVACEILNKHNILVLHTERIYKRVVKELINIRDNVVKVNKIDYESLIGDFIAMNQMAVLVMKNGHPILEPRGSLLIRVETEPNNQDSTLFINKTAFNKYLMDSLVSRKEFIYNMKESNINVTEGRKRMDTGWKTTLKDLNVHVYQLKSKTSIIPEQILAGEVSEST